MLPGLAPRRRVDHGVGQDDQDAVDVVVGEPDRCRRRELVAVFAGRSSTRRWPCPYPSRLDGHGRRPVPMHGPPSGTSNGSSSAWSAGVRAWSRRGDRTRSGDDERDGQSHQQLGSCGDQERPSRAPTGPKAATRTSVAAAITGAPSTVSSASNSGSGPHQCGELRGLRGLQAGQERLDHQVLEAVALGAVACKDLAEEATALPDEHRLDDLVASRRSADRPWSARRRCVSDLLDADTAGCRGARTARRATRGCVRSSRPGRSLGRRTQRGQLVEVDGDRA